MGEPKHQLDLRDEQSGWRYYLAGEPISAGTLLEIYSEQAGWISGTYEWNYQPDSKPYLVLDGVAVKPIEETDFLRWPEE